MTPTRRLWPAVLATWLFAAAILCLALAPTITGLLFPDPDDAMRLLEVRDWLGGQSWWDVGQHRLNGGDYPMHWSRLVDLPLAAVMMVCDPLVGSALSTRIAMTLVPLSTLLAVIALVAGITRRLAGDEPARLAMLLAPLSVPLLFQLRPMRIDHHGWQVVFALGAAYALLGAPTARRGALAGVSLAMLVTISLEGLPIAAILGATAAVAWAVDPRRRGFLVALLGSFFLAALALHVATRGPAMFAPTCDAMSPGWLAVLGAAALGVGAATLAAPATRTMRLAALVAAAALCVAALLAVAPACARGPFATLDPLVRTLWYDNVAEGLPLWRQAGSWAAMTIALPLVGLYGSVQAYRRSDGIARGRWLLLLALLVPGIALTCLVNRTGATTNALALPGAAALLLALLTRARAVPGVLPRIAATIGAFAVASPGLAVGAAPMLATAMFPTPPAPPARATAPRCAGADAIRVLGSLPAGIVFLPLDLTPDLIATTPQRAISGAYHRNVAAIHAVLAAFTASPAAAERIVRAHHATYVAGCASTGETDIYARANPNGLWARLERGERVPWLRRIVLRGSPVLVWRVIGSSRKALSPEASSL